MSYRTHKNWFYQLYGRYVHLWQIADNSVIDTLGNYKIRLPAERTSSQLIYPDEDITNGLRIEYTSFTESDLFIAEALETTTVTVSGATIAFVDGGGGADTITDGGNGFLAAGFKAGDIINISGTSNNEGLETIVSLVAGTITLATGRVATEDCGGDSITFSLVNTGFSLKTKVFDFGNPESKKNLLEVAVVYNGKGNSALDFDIITDDGTSTKVDALDNVSGSTVTEEFDESGVAALQGQKTYQIHINGTCDALFELYSITLTYRDLGVH